MQVVSFLLTDFEMKDILTDVILLLYQKFPHLKKNTSNKQR